MNDILIIFTVLLLLLITISTLGGSMSFIGKYGGSEYFTSENASKAKTLSSDAHNQEPVVPLAKSSKPTSLVPSVMPPNASKNAPKEKSVNTLIPPSNAPPIKPKPEIEGFQGAMYASA